MPNSGSERQLQEVRKTLVIGLGTTGVRICRFLAERISEEFGSVNRTPWIKFLCLETNTGEADSHSQTMPIIPISISNEEYRRHLNDRSTLQQLILWEDWADFPTLNRIHDITTGAGNIRMAGRLAFLHPTNYHEVVKRLQAVVSELRELDVVTATEARGELKGGINPQVVFSGEGGITYVVVGSLCGGTASGISTDFGYFLREKFIRQDGDAKSKLMAIFTLPRPDLQSSIYEKADLFKKNAFCALKEMYHYSQTGTNEYTVKYPDNEPIKRREVPYDLIMLAWPTEGTHESETALNRAVAERVFANTFIRDTDPFVRAIDARAVVDYGDSNKKYKSFFCTFGLSLMEYPAPRLTDACAYRLMHYAIDKWLNASAGPPQIEQLSMEIGLTWDRLKQDLLFEAKNPENSLRRFAENKVDEIIKHPSRWNDLIGKIRLSFGDQTGVSPDPSLPPNFVPTVLSRAAESAGKRIMGRINHMLRSKLTDIDFGVTSVLSVLEEARQNLRKILQEASVTRPTTQQLETYLRQLESAKGNILLKITFLTGKVAGALRYPILKALEEYIDRRVDELVLETLRNEVIPKVTEDLDKIIKRLRNLEIRLKLYREFLNQEAQNLSQPPVINGVMPIEENEADACYRRCLDAVDDIEALEKNQNRQAKELLSSWTQITQSLLGVETDSIFDHQPPSGSPREIRESAVSKELHAPLLDRARLPFQSIMSVNVLERWHRHPSRNGLLTDFARQSAPFIRYDDAVINRLKGAPPVSQQALIYPNGGSEIARDFENQVSAKIPNLDKKETSSQTRAVIVRDFYCIPIEALSGVTDNSDGTPALETARTNAHETFSRIDVYGWEPISKQERELEKRYRTTLGMAVIAGIAQVRENKLRVPYEPEQFGDTDFRLLPPDFNAAVRVCAVRGRDVENRSLSNLESILSQMLYEKLDNLGPEGFIKFFRERLERCGQGLHGWDRYIAGEILNDYCKENPTLLSHVNQMPPPSYILNSLKYTSGQTTSNGNPAHEDGYYCIKPGCGDFLGASIEECQSIGWKCKTCDTNYRTPVDSNWVREAQRLKQQ
jgi:hypothetical protein